MNTTHIKQIGANGGTVSTHGQSAQAKQAIDCAVWAGRKQAGRI